MVVRYPPPSPFNNLDMRFADMVQIIALETIFYLKLTTKIWEFFCKEHLKTGQFSGLSANLKRDVITFGGGGVPPDRENNTE